MNPPAKPRASRPARVVRRHRAPGLAARFVCLESRHEGLRKFLAECDRRTLIVLTADDERFDSSITHHLRRLVQDRFTQCFARGDVSNRRLTLEHVLIAAHEGSLFVPKFRSKPTLHDGIRDVLETVISHGFDAGTPEIRNEIAMKRVLLAVFAEGDFRAGLEVRNAHPLSLEVNSSPGLEPCFDQVFDDFLLSVDGHGFTTGQAWKVDSVRAAPKSQQRSFVSQPFTLEAFTQTVLFEEFDRAMLGHLSTNALFDVLAGA